jgi:hypothetical protein
MIANPPMLTGSAEQQVLQMRTYLYQLAEALNVALAEVDKKTDTSVAQVQQVVSTTQSENTSSYANLRDLIVKTADTVYLVQDTLKHTMSSDYVAISAFGSYYESIKSDVEETAKGVLTNYNFDAKIDDLRGDYGNLLGWTARVEGYIRQGIIGEDDDGLPVIGIAIGQNLRSLGKQTVEGVEYDILDDTQSCAFYTSTGISFRLGGREVAYLTNEREFITMLEVGTTMTLGGKWIVSHANGFTIKWIGVE